MRYSPRTVPTSGSRTEVASAPSSSCGAGPAATGAPGCRAGGPSSGSFSEDPRIRLLRGRSTSGHPAEGLVDLVGAHVAVHARALRAELAVDVEVRRGGAARLVVQRSRASGSAGVEHAGIQARNARRPERPVLGRVRSGACHGRARRQLERAVAVAGGHRSARPGAGRRRPARPQGRDLVRPSVALPGPGLQGPGLLQARRDARGAEGARGAAGPARGAGGSAPGEAWSPAPARRSSPPPWTTRSG
jgi:hypothetical protein